jgi:hypothetical protein
MNSILQQHWAILELVGIDSMAFSDGSIKLIDISCKRNKEIVNTFGKEYHFDVLRTASLEEIIEKYDNDIWSSCQINDQIDIGDNHVFVCGEGGMGNEGFIAKLDKDGNIQWSLFSTTSNPFYQFVDCDGQLQVISTANFAIRIDLSTDSISIDNYL